MQNLYTLTVNGDTFYYLGYIPEEKYDEVNDVIKNIPINPNDQNNQDFNHCLVSEMAKRDIAVSVTEIQYVFRKT